MSTPKLFLITRQDLAQGPRAVQMAHALREFVARYPAIDAEWYRTSNTLALLEVSSEPDLAKLAQRAERRGVPVARFHEPDLDNALTAIAIAPSGKSLCRVLPLALSAA